MRVRLAERQADAWADDAELAVERAVRQLGDQVARQVAAGEGLAALAGLAVGWPPLLDELVMPALRAAWYGAALATDNALQGARAQAGALVADAAGDHLDAVRAHLVRLPELAWEQARARLADGIAAGATPQQLAAQLAEVTGDGIARARVLARDLAVGTSNAAALATVRAAGMVGTKTWRSRRDDRVRATHARSTGADGQTVDLDQRFTVGGWPMDYPHDPAGPPEEVAGCRCGLRFDVHQPKPARSRRGRPSTGPPPTVAATPPPEVVDSGRAAAPDGEGGMPWQVRDDHPDCPDGYAVVNAQTGELAPGGCHPTRDEALAHQRALQAAAEDEGDAGAGGGAATRRADGAASVATGPTPGAPAAPPPPPTGDPTAGRRTATLAFEGIPTREYPAREFQPGALTWVEPPFPLKWQQAEAEGHQGAVIVGRVDRVWRDGDRLRGELTFDLDGAHGAEAHRLVQGRFLRGGSLLADDITDADLDLIFPQPAGPGGLVDCEAGDCDGQDTGPPAPPTDELVALMLTPERVVFRSGRIRSWTLVAEPAFADALIDDDLQGGGPAMPEPEPGLLPLATDDHFTHPSLVELEAHFQEQTWDGNAAMSRCSSSNTPAACFRSICAGRKAGPPDERGSWALPHHATAGGPPVPAGVRNALSRLPQTQGLTNEAAARAHLQRHMSAISGPEAALVAAAHTVTIPDVPPAWWFTEPTEDPAIGAVTITDEGRLFGLLGPAGVAHRGHRRNGRDVYVPAGTVDYSRWQNKTALVEADDGRVERIPAGNITMDCGHGPAWSAAAAREHYDNSCSIVAKARVGENARGTWIAGALLPDVTPGQVARMLGCALSGHWDPHEHKAGWSELTAALLVPCEGFPKAQPASVRVRDGMLVASAVPVRLLVDPSAAQRRQATDELAGVRARRLAADRIGLSIGRGRAATREVLRGRVHPTASTGGRG